MNGKMNLSIGVVVQFDNQRYEHVILNDA